MNDIQVVIGQQLRTLRLSKGLTQQQVAKLIKFERTTYTKYETGNSEINYSTLIMLAKIFDTDFNTLLCYDRFKNQSI